MCMDTSTIPKLTAGQGQTDILACIPWFWLRFCDKKPCGSVWFFYRFFYITSTPYGSVTANYLKRYSVSVWEFANLYAVLCSHFWLPHTDPWCLIFLSCVPHMLVCREVDLP